MTRETKIGLVVGLGFIVVFGILLSHRGSGQQAPPPVEWDRGHTPPTLVRTDASPGQEKQTDSSKDVGDTVEVARDVVRAVPVSSDPLAGGIELPAVGGAVSPDGVTTTTTATAPSTPSTSDTAREAGTPGGNEPTREPQAPGRSPRTDPQPPLDLDPRKPRFPIQHVVASGDTLSSLARMYYGTADPDAIETIFEANRNLLPGPDDLKLKQTLKIPTWASAEKFEAADGDSTVADLAQGRYVSITTYPNRPNSTRPTMRAADPPARRNEVPATAAADVKWQWYEIGPNETYFGIARKKLGRSSRWQEIHDLNKSDYPDPRRIPTGTRIKLPGV